MQHNRTALTQDSGRKRIVIEWKAADGYDLRLGQIQNLRASKTHPAHSHLALEFIYVESGCQSFAIGERAYELKGQDILVIPPGLSHDTAGEWLQKSKLYWLQIKLPPNAKEGFLGYRGKWGRSLLQSLKKLEPGIYRGNPGMAHLLRMFFQIFPTQTSHREIRLHLLLTRFLLDFLSLAEVPPPVLPQAVSHAKKWIEKNLSEPITLKDLAHAIGVSPAWLKRSFKQSVGIPPLSYIHRQKLSAAQRLLERGVSVTETAVELGFSSSQYFSVVFRRYLGITPGEWQRRSHPPPHREKSTA